ncbi:unnamed protein product [Closterium sp. NIES-53]
MLQTSRPHALTLRRSRVSTPLIGRQTWMQRWHPGSPLALTVKRPPGSPPVFKARYVARGFSQREGVDFFKTFSPTPKMTTLRVLLHVAAQRDYELHSLDFSIAFLQGSLHEEIWLRRPPGFTGSFPPGTQWSLRRPVYGLRQALREWHDTLRTTLAALGFSSSTADPSLFLRTDTSLPPFHILVYVDDLVFATADTEALAHVKSKLQKRHTCTDLGPSVLRLHLVLSTGHSSGYSTSGMGLVLGGRRSVVLTGHSDASWVDDQASQRSSQGYTFSLGSGSVSWRSTRSSSILSSSCEDDIYATAMVAEELRWLTYLLTDLGERPSSPPVLYVDNKAAIALCQEQRLEHRTKHIALRYFLARELQQRGQLFLRYVATQVNTADLFTKALQPACFAFLDCSCDPLLSPTLAMGFQPASPLPGPSPYAGPTRGLTERREPESRLALRESRPTSPTSRSKSLVPTVRTGRRVSHPRPPPVPGTHSMTLRPSTAPQRVPLPSPPASSLPDGPDPESDSLRTSTPMSESTAASARVTELFYSAAACRLDYATSLVAESASVCPPSVGGECALGTDVLEDRQEEFECFAAASPHLVSMLLAPEGDPDAPDIPTLRSYTEAIEGPYSSQWTTLASLGFAPSTANPSLFLRTDTTLPPFYVLVYVDDLVFATADTEALAHVKSELQKRHTCTDLGELTSYLGLRITRDRAQRTITLTQSHMVHQVLQRFGFTYSSPQSTPLPTGHSLSAPPSDEFVELSSPYAELVGCLILSGMGLVLGGRARVVLTGHADASWVDDLATQRSSQGYTFSLGSGSVSWRSTRSSSVLNSSCEAEIYAGAMAAQELRWLTYLLTDLGEAPRSPPVLYVDNKAMLALCKEHRLEHRMKNIALRYFLARELQQRGQFRLAYVASQANTADVFTNALQPCDHQRFCNVLGLVPTVPHLLTS